MLLSLTDIAFVQVFRFHSPAGERRSSSDGERITAVAQDKSQLSLLRRPSLHESDHHAIAAALNIPEKKKGAEWGE